MLVTLVLKTQQRALQEVHPLSTWSFYLSTSCESFIWIKHGCATSKHLEAFHQSVRQSLAAAEQYCMGLIRWTQMRRILGLKNGI